MGITFEASSFAVCYTVCTYLTSRCVTPPTPPPANPYATDRLTKFHDVNKTNFWATYGAVFWNLWHILLAIFPRHRAQMCLHPEFLNEALFGWSSYTIVYMLVMFTFAPLRLAAYKGLGKDFTYQLAVPKKLITTGIYAYVQHPSYVGLAAVCIANLLVGQRLDGVAACFLPKRFLELRGLNEMVAIGGAVLMVGFLLLRVKDEEDMLRKEFGREWEEYHRRTKRFIPGIF